MSDASLILTGKRKRAAVSYVEPDEIAEAHTDEEQVESASETDLDDSDDDQTFSTRRKVFNPPLYSHPVSFLTLS